MKLDHRDFMRVASETGLDGAQAERFWQALADGAAKRPGFDLVHVLYYFGGLIVIGAVSWFMTATWDALGPNGILVMSVLIGAALLALGNTLWRRSEATRVPGGLLIAAAVSTTPLIVYSLQDAFGLWPGDAPGNYHDFHIWVRGGWAAMELVTISVGLVALRFYRLPFLVAPIAFTLWYLSMDLTPIIFGSDGYDWRDRQLVSLLFGLAMLVTAYLTDLAARRDFAFWLYLFGMIAFWGGLSSMDSGSEWGKVIYLLINLALIALSVFLRRRVFIVFGGLGVFGYLGYLAYDKFADQPLFMFVLMAAGLALVFIGIYLQRNRTAILAWAESTIPQGLQQFRPKG